MAFHVWFLSVSVMFARFFHVIWVALKAIKIGTANSRPCCKHFPTLTPVIHKEVKVQRD